MAKTTKDGLTIYDLDPQASELWVVAGPAGIDPKTIDTDNLPDGFRWVEAEEWEELQGIACEQIYFAVCNVNGPISRKIVAESVQSAVAQFEAMDHQHIVDSVSTDAETELGIDASGMSEHAFAAALETAGYTSVCDLSPILLGQQSRAYHAVGGWMLWSRAQ